LNPVAAGVGARFDRKQGPESPGSVQKEPERVPFGAGPAGTVPFTTSSPSSEADHSRRTVTSSAVVAVTAQAPPAPQSAAELQGAPTVPALQAPQ
jgi:hypothetical protein